MTELRSSVLADRIEADLATGEGASLVGELRVLLSADPLGERPRALLMRALTSAVVSIACVVVASYRMNLIVGHAAVRTRTAACQRGQVPCASCQRARETP